MTTKVQLQVCQKMRDTHSGFIESIFWLGRGGVLRQYEAGGQAGSECYESREREMHINVERCRELKFLELYV